MLKDLHLVEDFSAGHGVWEAVKLCIYTKLDVDVYIVYEYERICWYYYTNINFINDDSSK